MKKPMTTKDAEPKLPDTKTSNYNEPIHFWAKIDTDNDGRINKFDITILDPTDNKRVTMNYKEFKKYPHDDPAYLNYDWKGLEHEIENVRLSAIDGGRHKKERLNKKTYNDVIYRNIHYYKKNSEEKGTITEKVSLEVNKKSKTPVKSTEETIETFYTIELSEEVSGKLWLYDNILDDLLKRDIKDVRIFTGSGVFYVNTDAFLTHGSVEKKKVYISIDTYPFKVNEMCKGQFDVYTEVSK